MRSKSGNGSHSSRLAPCPLCFSEFSLSVIEAHASSCTGHQKRTCRKPVNKRSQVSSESVSGSSSENEEHENEKDKKKGGRKENSEEEIPSTSKSDSSTLTPSSSSRRKNSMKKPRHISPNKKKVEADDDEDEEEEKEEKEKEKKKEKEERQNFKIKFPALTSAIPLSEEMRPKTLKDFISLPSNHSSFLSSILNKQNGNVPNVIFWGPPGSGKTSLANLLSHQCKEGHIKAKFVKLSACVVGINDVREVVTKAKNEWSMLKRRTILFMDEIHRFNKVQQDAFLPHIENGTITLIGASTENPSTCLNTSLLSRCKVLSLIPHSSESLKILIKKALCLRGLSSLIDSEAIDYLSEVCGGDARVALNSLEISSSIAQELGEIINIKIIQNSLSSSPSGGVRGCETNESEHYNSASALQKSIRASNTNAALYYTMRLLIGGEDPLFIARRFIRIASEDIGLADTGALSQAVSAWQACNYIGSPESHVILAQLAIYLARAPKSSEVIDAMKSALSILQSTHSSSDSLPPIPLHLRNTNWKKDETEDSESLSFMPKGLENSDFFLSKS